MNSAIEGENLTKYYDKILAVDHINFTRKKGKIFGFLGPNGTCKTTTQRTLIMFLAPIGLDLGGDKLKEIVVAKLSEFIAFCYH